MVTENWGSDDTPVSKFPSSSQKGLVCPQAISEPEGYVCVSVKEEEGATRGEGLWGLGLGIRDQG